MAWVLTFYMFDRADVGQWDASIIAPEEWIVSADWLVRTPTGENLMLFCTKKMSVFLRAIYILEHCSKPQKEPSHCGLSLECPVDIIE